MLGKVDPTPLKPGMAKLLQVVPIRKSDKAPSVKLSCEGRILGRLEVLGKDGRHKGFGVEDHEGFSVGYPSYDVPVPFVGEDFHQLVAVVVGMSQKSQLVGMCEAFIGFQRQPFSNTPSVHDRFTT